MKKQNVHIIILTIFLTIFLFESFSQITVSKIEQRNISSSSEGFIYTLPQTTFKIDVVYEKTQEFNGPLMQYATEYLGAKNYISSDKTEYKVKDVSLSVFQEPDLDQLYYVKYPDERAKDAKKISFTLSRIGGLLAYNTELPVIKETPDIVTDQTIIFKEGDNRFPYMSQYNKQKKVDTIIRVINIDTVTINRFLFKSSWVDKSDDDKAKEAAQQIEQIRESRYHLVSGYQEVNYGTSIVYMDMQLQKMEDKYLELFLGKTTKSVEKQTIYFVPVKNKKQSELLRFDDGTTVEVKIETGSNSNKLTDVTASSPDRIYYRIPAPANVIVSSKNHTLFTGRFAINQLGAVSTAPLANTKLQFDANTGNLINITRE